MAKRLKYAKDVLAHMLDESKKAAPESHRVQRR
jgi:hypothetical protein